MIDKQTTAIAWRFLGNHFVLIAAMIATVIFGVPKAFHAGQVAGKFSAEWLCQTLGIME
ncbi:hypothetical protein [Acetobacter vaccinii]|uniref:hypothetical protein n=1 Tax=Acetobacter vaccinii TaxID=2592655 RepID=UPI00143D5663|nr:hypothetical protein [Acetobacter vaccinii]